MLNNYYTLEYSRNLVRDDIIDLVFNGSDHLEVAGSYNDGDDYECEFSHSLKAKTNDKAVAEAKEFLAKEWNVEIYAVVKYHTEIIATEED